MSEARDARILVVDDDENVVAFLREGLEEAGFLTEGTTRPEEVPDLVLEQSYDLLLVDLEMPGMRGTDILSKVHEVLPAQLVLLMTAFGSIELAVSCVRAGACDFIAKPFRIEALVVAIDRALRERRMHREIVRLRVAQRSASTGGIVARSVGMQRALAVADRVASSSATVLLTGETGTGKSALAKYLHDRGNRRHGPFVELNCAAMPSLLIESELFGVRQGAFTDARRDRHGLFVAADGGTLLLDEIGELTLDLQAKLLRVLETGRVRPLGGTEETVVDARIVAATNRSLEAMLKAGEFRPDLYYRLNVIRIEVPPLRQRRDDILPLVDHILHEAGLRHTRAVVGVSAPALRRLQAHSWPGNVRELTNVIERAVALGQHDTILPEDLEFQAHDGDVEQMLGGAAGRQASLDEIEREYVKRIVDAQEGNKAAAARILGINRRTLYRKLGR